MASRCMLDVPLKLRLAAERCVVLAVLSASATLVAGVPVVPAAEAAPADAVTATFQAPGVPGARCAEPFGGVRAADVTYMLATPREDTVLDRSDGPPSFGQLAEATRVSGADGRRAGEALEDDPSVVLVPWGFDESCEPIAWTGSWRWAATGEAGFYRGRLRPPHAWIEGRPTFDVHSAVWEGFPRSPWEHPLSVGRPSLSAQELFDLYDRLPTAEAIASRPYGAVSELVTWRRDAGQRAERYPARTLLNAAFDLAELARVRRAPLPFSGTYRVRVEDSGQAVATFFLRTGSAGVEPLNLLERSAGSVPTAPRPASAYAAPVALAASAGRLDEPPDPGPRSECFRDRGLRATADEAPKGDAAHAWSAELSIPFVASCFDDAGVLRDLRTGEPASASGTHAEDGTAFVGIFRQEADGRFTFHQDALLEDGTPVQLIGERIGVVALPAPSPLPRVSVYRPTSGG